VINAELSVTFDAMVVAASGTVRGLATPEEDDSRGYRPPRRARQAPPVERFRLYPPLSVAGAAEARPAEFQASVARVGAHGEGRALIIPSAATLILGSMTAEAEWNALEDEPDLIVLLAALDEL
jgi:hypothetical protein